MRLSESVSKTSIINNDKPREEPQYHCNRKSSEDTEFTVVDVMSKPTHAKPMVSESTQRTNNLFMELLNNQTRSKV